ncbi:MAG: formate dehydrogenase accessory sulfurtransferase FdhD [Hyphomicrobium sp.]|nr:formate dehydrogenase accessory sulfurtransferase FdhD [Hyphomicrobium sp.]
MNVMPKAAFANAASGDACSRAASGIAYGADGSQLPVSWQLPDETPVALQFNSQPFAVMMATPADLRDFAIGLSVAEDIIREPGRIQGVLVMPVDNGITVDIAVPEDAIQKNRLVRRAIEGRSGCGLCGVEDIASALRPLTAIARSWEPEPDAILKAAAGLSAKQPMNRLNRSVHAAAWVSPDGDILIVREDVGRHNALDKLIGALVQAGIDTASGFVVMTSRCSYELVQKCVTAGIGALVTVSAPTALALDIAKSANLFLASLHRDAVVVFNA